MTDQEWRTRSEWRSPGSKIHRDLPPSMQVKEWIDLWISKAPEKHKGTRSSGRMALAHSAKHSLARIPARPSFLCRRAAAARSDRQVEPPDLAQLCEKARLSLTPEEIADFTPKIASVVDWFSQLQDVDVENVAPAVRVGEVEGVSTLRPDVPVIFQEGEAMLAAAPEREGPYLKVPKILKENVE